MADTQAADSQAAYGKAADGKAEDPKAEDSRVDDSHADDSQGTNSEPVAGKSEPAASQDEENSSSTAKERDSATLSPGRMQPSSRLSLTGITPSDSDVDQEAQDDTDPPAQDAEAVSGDPPTEHQEDAKNSEENTQQDGNPPGSDPDDRPGKPTTQDDRATHAPSSGVPAKEASTDAPDTVGPDAVADDDDDNDVGAQPTAGEQTATGYEGKAKDAPDPATPTDDTEHAEAKPATQDTAPDKPLDEPTPVATDDDSERGPVAPPDTDQGMAASNSAPAWANLGRAGMIETGVAGATAQTPQYIAEPPSRFSYRGRFSAAMIPFDLWPERPSMPFNLPTATRNPPRRPMSIQDALNASAAERAMEEDDDISIPARLRRDEPALRDDHPPSPDPDELPPLPEEDDLRSEDEVLDEAFAGSAELDPTRAPADDYDHDDTDPGSEEHMVARRLKSARRRPRKNFLMRKYRIVPTHFWPAPWRRKWREMRFGRPDNTHLRDDGDDQFGDYPDEEKA